MKKVDYLDERSDFVKEILESPPNNIISWGNTFVSDLYCFNSSIKLVY
jgi:hypothetical protein